jgi:hypothetical protein
MYEQALRGYEAALGPDNIMTYIPALNTLWGLGSLFKHQADYTKARIIYSNAHGICWTAATFVCILVEVKLRR